VSVDPALVSALERQLERRRALLDAGAERIGWKLGMGASERIGDHPAVGYLTSASRLDPGATYRAGRAVRLSADAEIAVELRRAIDPDEDAAAAHAAISGFAAAIELVDLGSGANAEDIVATNIFHRAFALGERQPTLPDHVCGTLLVDRKVRDTASADTSLGERLLLASRVLAAVGERLQAGDRVITGSIVQVPVAPGDHIAADLGDLGGVELRLASGAGRGAERARS